MRLTRALQQRPEDGGGRTKNPKGREGGVCEEACKEEMMRQKSTETE